MPPGRPRNNEPGTAYDRRRYITLVQVLAGRSVLTRRSYPLQALAKGWGVNPYGDYTELLQRLAQRIIEYHRSEDATPPRRP